MVRIGFFLLPEKKPSSGSGPTPESSLGDLLRIARISRIVRIGQRRLFFASHSLGVPLVGRPTRWASARGWGFLWRAIVVNQYRIFPDRFLLRVTSGTA